MASDKLTKNQKRRLKKKLEKQSAGDASENGVSAVVDNTQQQAHDADDASPPDVAVEYVSLDVKKEIALPESDPAYEEFLRIFGTFSSAEELCGQIPVDDNVRVIIIFPQCCYAHLTCGWVINADCDCICVVYIAGHEGR